VSLRKATLDAHNELLSLVNPDVDLLALTSYTTIRKLVIELFVKSKETIKG
jgi:hypothetical protein